MRCWLFGVGHPWLWLLLGATIGNPVLAQWEDVSTEFLLSASCTGSYLGCGISCADFNADGKDDLTVSQASGNVSLYLRTEDGFVLEEELEGEGEATGVLWVDIDGDGDLDLFTGHQSNGVRLYVRSEAGNLVDETFERGLPDWVEWDPRGFSASDFDHDHDLDIYVASYHINTEDHFYPNALLVNDGFGFFSVADDSVGVNDGIKSSFQGAWLDFDQDGWMDLWVINDRAIFTNAMFHNQGDGTFVDVALEEGLLDVINPMTATVFDPDQDGDWDLFCTEGTNLAHALFEQTDSGFVDVATDAGLAGMDDFGWGACVIDVDGDAREDLMVATLNWPSEFPADNRMMMALDSGLTFEEDLTGWPNEQFPLYHLGRFDLDNDRAPDIIGHGAIPIAQMLLNENAEGASRMTVRLVGTTANSKAVGALIEVYANGRRQMQQVDAGTDYVTQHSYTRFYGMDSIQSLDSLVVTWPGAESETWYGLNADTAHVLVQGSAGAMPISLIRDCPWDPQGWQVPTLDGAFELTLDGVPISADTLWFEASGASILEATWWNGAASMEWVLTSEVQPEGDPGFQAVPPLCFGDSSTFSWAADGAQNVVWMDSLSLPLDTLLHVALDSVAIEWQYGPQCTMDTLIVLDIPEALTLSLDVDQPSCFGEPADVILEAGGGTPPLEVSWGGADPDSLTDGTWPVSVQDSVGCVLLDSALVVSPAELDVVLDWSFYGASDTVLVELDITGGTVPYVVDWFGGLDSAGWALAPTTLGWTVEDAQGCGQSGNLDLEINGAPLLPASFSSPLRCWRSGGFIGFDGPPLRGRIEIFDLTGRLFWSGLWSSSDLIPCDFDAPLIVRAYPRGGAVQVFLR